MRHGKLIVAITASLAVVGCFEEPEMPKPVPARLPENVCSQVTEALAKLDASGMLQRTQPAEIVLEEQAWLQLPQSTKEQITKLIGFDAACKAAEPPMEQTVTVRSEYGRVMAQPIITTSVDLGTLLQD